MKKSTKKSIIIILIAITIIMMIVIFRVKKSHIDVIQKVISLLNETYGEEFVLDEYIGYEYENSLFPTLKKTGRGKLNAHKKGFDDTKFEVYFQYDPTEIISDYYLEANICYNTSRKIEQDYKIGKNMYVFTRNNSTMYFSDDENPTATLFDVNYPNAIASICIYVEGLDDFTEQEIYDYETNIATQLKLNINEYSTISVIKVKSNAIEKIKKCYEDDNTASIKYNLMYENMDIKNENKYIENEYTINLFYKQLD